MVLGWERGRRKMKHINTETSEMAALPLPSASAKEVP